MKILCLIVTVVAVLMLSAPTAVINPLIPFAVLLLLYLLYRFILSRRIRRKGPVNAGFMVAVILLVPIALLVSAMDGGGFASGPFYAEDYGGDFTALTPSGSVPYGRGQLVSYERGGNHAPILAYVERRQVRWASELKTGDDPALTVQKVVEMEVHPGMLRDRIDFFAVGTSEPGWAYVYKTGRVQKFYLKMF